MLKSLFFVLVFSVFGVSSAFGGVVLRGEVDRSEGQKKKPIMTMTIDGRNMAVDIDESRESTRGAMIFRGAEQKMLLITHPKKSYMVLDEKTLAQINSQLSAQIAQTKELLASLPPEQRKMVEAQMKQMEAKPQPKAEKWKIKHLTTTKVIDGRTCHEVEAYAGDVLAAKGCVMKADAMFKKIVPALNDVQQFSKNITKAAGNFMPQDAAGMNQMFPPQVEEIGGIPLQWENYHDGKRVGGWRLVDLKETAVAASTFQPPKGYNEQSLPAALGQ